MKTGVGERRFQEVLGGYRHLISERNRLLCCGGINSDFPCFPSMGCLLQQRADQAQALGRCRLAGVGKKQTEGSDLPYSDWGDQNWTVCYQQFCKSHYMVYLYNAYLIVPLNKIGSWRMIDSLDLNVCKGSFAISMPSMIILPIQKKIDCVSHHTAAAKNMAHFQLAKQYSRNRPWIARPLIHKWNKFWISSEHNCLETKPQLGGIQSIPIIFYELLNTLLICLTVINICQTRR